MIAQAVPRPADHAPPSRSRARAARLVAFAGWLALAASGALLLLAAAHPLGLVTAYPEPPAAAVAGPLGRTAPIAGREALDRVADEPLPDYLARLTETVAAGMVHYWTAGDTWTPGDAAYTGISIYDNYLLWLLGRFPPYRDHLQNYEFVSPRQAVARGYGFCSQVSKLVYTVLREQGIPSRILVSERHVVVESGGMLLDADYGVFAPRDLDWLRRHPDEIDRHYARYPGALPLLRDVFGDDWQVLGSDAVFDDSRAFEEKAERFKWLLPMFGLAAGVALLLLARNLGRAARVGDGHAG